MVLKQRASDASGGSYCIQCRHLLFSFCCVEIPGRQPLSLVLFQHHHHYFLLPRPLHLFPGPGQRLVREPGPVFALEREEEADLPQLGG